MQKQTFEQTAKNDLKVLLGTIIIGIATNAAIFNIHQGPKQAVISKDELRKIFEHEKETLHMPHNYGARGRYTVILGNE